MKVRACADGRKQRKHITKEEVASPTIQTTSLLLSLLIDAEEKREVATVDVVGAYLIADMKYKVIVKLAGDAVDVMCKVNNKYNPFVSIEKGRKVIYVRLRKALYGCM